MVLVSRRLEDKNESLGLGFLVLNIWSWSRSWRKSLAVFQDFCCNSWRQWARHNMAFCERQQKHFGIRKRLFEKTFCAPCISASVERVFNNGGYLLGHTDTSKAQCTDCGKLLSLISNKPGKQTVSRVEMSSRKMPQRYLYTVHVHEESGIPSTRTTCKKGETGRGTYWRRIVGLTWWLNVWKGQKH